MEQEKPIELKDLSTALHEAFSIINEIILPVSQAERILKARNIIAAVNNALLDKMKNDDTPACATDQN